MSRANHTAHVFLPGTLYARAVERAGEREQTMSAYIGDLVRADLDNRVLILPPAPAIAVNGPEAPTVHRDRPRTA